jgi:hypothetical protein
MGKVEWCGAMRYENLLGTGSDSFPFAAQSVLAMGNQGWHAWHHFVDSPFQGDTMAHEFGGASYPLGPAFLTNPG